jgi:hypothetical protein
MEYDMQAQRVLELKNKSLLSKWLYKLMNENGMWQELLQKKS